MTLITPLDVGQVLQRIYDSEINFMISSPLWDSGFSWRLGDEASGWDDGNANVPEIAVAVHQLALAVTRHHPDSDFTKWWHEAIAV